MATGDTNRDRSLFRRISEGDAAAFKEIFDTYYDSIRINALKFLKSDFWAEEITQEVFVQLWDNKHKLSLVENPAAWLYRATANKCIDRSRRHAIELRAQYAIHRSLASSFQLVQENRHDNDALSTLVRDAISQLPGQQRKALLLRIGEDLSYKEIAERLNISHNTVRNHLIRAFESVRKYVQLHGEFLPVLWIFLKYFRDM